MNDDLVGGPFSPDIPLLAPTAAFVYEALVDIGPMLPLGRSPLGERRMIQILGGRFAGPSMSGDVLPGGADRQVIGDDGVRRLEALYEMQIDDGTILTIRNRVLIYDPVDLPRYAFSSVEITAPEGPHDWLNKRVFVGALHGLQPRPQVLIRVFAIG